MSFRAGSDFQYQLAVEVAVVRALHIENTGKTAAFFSITTNNLITVRRSSDYVAQMVGMAGGVYIFDDLEGETSAQSTIKLPLETFYARAKDADVLIYNSTIEGVMETRDQLIEKCPMLADFKAVQSGDCWCTACLLYTSYHQPDPRELRSGAHPHPPCRA